MSLTSDKFNEHTDCVMVGHAWFKCSDPDCLFFMCYACGECERRGMCCDDEDL